MSIPVYIAAGDEATRAACRDAFGEGATVVAGLEDISGAAPPGLVLVGAEEATCADVVRKAEALHAEADGWVFAAVDADAPPRVRSLSVGYPVTLQDAAAWAADPSSAPGRLLELRRTLAEMSRARHDINNPLTSALAETQLLLMDAEDPEARESLEVIQEQLRRLRDLVASTGHLRPPRD